MATIAALGTGVMGAPMARNLARAGHEVRAWNRSPDKAAPLRDDGVDGARRSRGRRGGRRRRADHAGRRRRGARRRAAREPRRGTDLVAGLHHRDRGTEQCAALAQRDGRMLVDAPVLGTRLPAEEGKLVVLASAPTPRSTRSRRSSTRSGSGPMRLGRRGHRDAAEARGQPWVLAVTQGTAETIAFAQALGVEPDVGPRRRSRAARWTCPTSA